MITKIEVTLHGGTSLALVSLALDLSHKYPDANLEIRSESGHLSFVKVSLERMLAQEILAQYKDANSCGKIGSLKAVRKLNPSLGLQEAKTLVESLFEFHMGGDVTIKEEI